MLLGKMSSKPTVMCAGQQCAGCTPLQSGQQIQRKISREISDSEKHINYIQGARCKGEP